jgi:hypothetical protein
MDKQQDETIRELFQQLKQYDELNVPSFASTFDHVRDDSREVEGHSLRWGPLATIAAVVLLASFGLYSALSTKRQETSVDTALKIPEATTSPSPTAVSPGVEAVESAASPRRTRVRSRPSPPAIEIASWRSPTAFLLPPPDDRFLRTSLRLDDSLIKIRPLLAGSVN